MTVLFARISNFFNQAITGTTAPPQTSSGGQTAIEAVNGTVWRMVVPFLIFGSIILGGLAILFGALSITRFVKRREGASKYVFAGVAIVLLGILAYLWVSVTMMV